MSSSRTCPRCGAAITDVEFEGGLCPACRLAGGLVEVGGNDLSGTTFGHYRVERKIGEGGMGEVYLARDENLERNVALKFLPTSLQDDETAQTRFLREAKAAAALDHPYLCKIYETGKSADRTFIAMEYVEGETLDARIAKGPLPVTDSIEAAEEITQALSKAHEQEIVHRDLKPSNIMMTRDGHVKVMDLGLAKRLIPSGEHGNKEAEISQLTDSFSAVGSLPFMSPEQARGEPVDSTAMLGCTLSISTPPSRK